MSSTNADRRDRLHKIVVDNLILALEERQNGALEALFASGSVLHSVDGSDIIGPTEIAEFLLLEVPGLVRYVATATEDSALIEAEVLDQSSLSAYVLLFGDEHDRVSRLYEYRTPSECMSECANQWFERASSYESATDGPWAARREIQCLTDGDREGFRNLYAVDAVVIGSTVPDIKAEEEILFGSKVQGTLGSVSGKNGRGYRQATFSIPSSGYVGHYLHVLYADRGQIQTIVEYTSRNDSASGEAVGTVIAG